MNSLNSFKSMKKILIYQHFSKHTMPIETIYPGFNKLSYRRFDLAFFSTEKNLSFKDENKSLQTDLKYLQS